MAQLLAPAADLDQERQTLRPGETGEPMITPAQIVHTLTVQLSGVTLSSVRHTVAR